MKQSIILLSLFLYINTCAQITTGQVRWKSASNIYYTYTGELKNGKPHGRGLAISEDTGAVWIQVFGEFKDGMIDGSTVIRHSTAKIIVAKWKENKPEGTGVIITPSQDIDYGNFVNGVMEGKVVSIQNDNSIVIDNRKNGKTNGRGIAIYDNGTIITDRMYVNDTANGPGYQYQAKDKQLFEGIWENGNWVRATTGSFPSFMRKSSFGSVVTPEAIFIYSELAEKDGKKVRNDTCFTYDIKNNNRWFGYYDHGQFKNGIKLIGDSLRMIGQLDDGRQQGFCVEFKKGLYLNIGNYKNGVLDGHGITVDIEDSTIYDGALSEGYYTGTAARLMKNKEIRIGNFNKGSMEGGKIIYPDGHAIVIGYDSELQMEYTTAIILPGGQKIDHMPEEVCTAINFLLKEWENNFASIKGYERSEISNRSFTTRFTNALNSWYQFPAAQFNRILPGSDSPGDSKHNEFICGITVSEDLPAVKKKYDDLCKKLTTCTITSLQKGKLLKLVPKLNQQKIDPENNRMASLFTIPAYIDKKNTAMIRVMVEKNLNEKYQLTLDIISK